MDAATLYTVISVASGSKRMTTQKYPTMAVCEEVADKLRKRASLKTSIYCVKRKPDASERAAAAAARRRAAQRRAPSPQAQAQAQSQAPVPVGMPRDFFSGTTPPKQ